VTVDALRNGPVAAAIRRHRLIVVLRRVAPQAALLDLVEELADAGARAFEITMDGPAPEADLAAVRERLGRRAGERCMVGGGTVLRRGQLEAARRAGADFAVAPLLDVDLVSTAVHTEMPFIPGALTPTEVHAAWTAGATFVKVFPASASRSGVRARAPGPAPDVEPDPDRRHRRRQCAFVPRGGRGGGRRPAARSPAATPPPGARSWRRSLARRHRRERRRAAGVRGAVLVTLQPRPKQPSPAAARCRPVTGVALLLPGDEGGWSRGR
jgi:2-dehydro-3-deoxyphosphogluconate aldolase/(4S)-4-hydroxy-2-oxoglutarate aldolase